MTKQELALRLVRANKLIEAMHKAIDNPGNAAYANHEQFKSSCKHVLDRHLGDLEKLAAELYINHFTQPQLEELILLVESNNPVVELSVMNEFLSQEAISRLVVAVYEQISQSTPRVVPTFHNN